MGCHHTPAPRPEMGGYILRDVHDGKPDGLLIARDDTQEKTITAAAGILAVQGYACRLARMVDEDCFKAQDRAYREEVLPPDTLALSPEAGESPAGLATRMLALLRGAR